VCCCSSNLETEPKEAWPVASTVPTQMAGNYLVASVISVSTTEIVQPSTHANGLFWAALTHA
jgi:hypothetical protein